MNKIGSLKYKIKFWKEERVRIMKIHEDWEKTAQIILYLIINEQNNELFYYWIFLSFL